MVQIVCEDGAVMDVDVKALALSETIKSMLDENPDAEKVPVQAAAAPLRKVLEYCSEHASDADAAALAEWDKTFMAGLAVDESLPDDERCKKIQELFDVTKTANYLNVKALLEKACDAIAGMIRGKTPEEIRKTFCVPPSGLTEEEEIAKARREAPWAFEDIPMET